MFLSLPKTYLNRTTADLFAIVCGVHHMRQTVKGEIWMFPQVWAATILGISAVCATRSLFFEFTALIARPAPEALVGAVLNAGFNLVSSPLHTFPSAQIDFYWNETNQCKSLRQFFVLFINSAIRLFCGKNIQSFLIKCSLKTWLSFWKLVSSFWKRVLVF